MNEADKELAARAESTFGVFTDVDAIEAGLTAEQCVHRIRSGRWIVIHRPSAFLLSTTTKENKKCQELGPLLSPAPRSQSP